MVVKNPNALPHLSHIGDSGVKCGGIIYNQEKDKVLVVMNRMSKWNKEFKWGFPKGNKKTKEQNVDCAMREIHEETGLSFNKEMMTQRKHIYGNIYFVLDIPIEYENKEFDVPDSKEVCEIKFMTLDELRKVNVNRDVRRFLQINK